MSIKHDDGYPAYTHIPTRLELANLQAFARAAGRETRRSIDAMIAGIILAKETRHP